MLHAILSIGLLLAADNLEAARTLPTYRILIALGLLVLFAGLLSTLWPFQAYEPELAMAHRMTLRNRPGFGRRC